MYSLRLIMLDGQEHGSRGGYLQGELLLAFGSYFRSINLLILTLLSTLTLTNGGSHTTRYPPSRAFTPRGQGVPFFISFHLAFQSAHGISWQGSTFSCISNNGEELEKHYILHRIFLFLEHKMCVLDEAFLRSPLLSFLSTNPPSPLRPWDD